MNRHEELIKLQLHIRDCAERLLQLSCFIFFSKDALAQISGLCDQIKTAKVKYEELNQ